MNNRLLRYGLVFLGFASALWLLHPASVTAAKHAQICGQVDPGETVLEPPALDMWKMPKSDRGLRELVLSVHRDGDRFCYHYTAGGVMHDVSPVIHVRPGESFAVRIVNDIASPSEGESVSASAIPPCTPMAMQAAPVQHFIGYLSHVIDERAMDMQPIDTNIHFHGFEGASVDDNIFLSTLSTPMHACEYTINIPKTQPPGTYFYHPHPHGMSNDEIAGGLAGVWIVDPRKPEVPAADDHLLVMQYQIPFERELVPIPSAAFLAATAAYTASRKPAALASYDPFHPPDWPLDYPLRVGSVSLASHACYGVRTDDRITINGSRTPATLDVPGARTQLIRIVNALSDGAKQLSLRDPNGTTVPMRIIAIDSVPAGSDVRPLARYIAADHYLIPPASRVSLLLAVPTGQSLVLHADRHCEGYLGARQVDENLLEIRGVPPPAGSGDTIATRPLSAADVPDTPAARLLAYARAHPSKIHRRAITYTQYILPALRKGKTEFAFLITDTTNRNFREHSYDPHYASGGDFPIHPDVVVKQGTIEEWYLINATPDRHSFHIHQMSFVDEKGPAGFPVSLDVADVPSGTLRANPQDPNHPLVRPTITKVLLDFRHVRKGTFVFHCHMLFHEDHGMMGTVRVE